MKRKKSESGNKCCVSTCDAIDDGTLTYHQFPRPGKKVVIKDVLGETFFCDRRKIWEDRVGQDFVINKYSKVCSLHFAIEDYCPKSKGMKVQMCPTFQNNRFNSFADYLPKNSTQTDGRPENMKLDIRQNDSIVILNAPNNFPNKLYFTGESSKGVIFVKGIQQSNRRLLATAVPSLYLPDEYSAFREFKQKPKLLEQVDVNGNNAVLRISSRLRRNYRKDSQKDVIPMKQLVQTDVKVTQQVVPNTESTLTAATTQQDPPPKSPKHPQESAVFQDKDPPPLMPEDSPQSAITETVVVIFKKEESDITENDIKLEIETEQVKLESTKQEDELLLDMLLMQTSYEMEKFTSGSCSTFAYV